MRALRCNQYGTIDELKIEEIDDPVPGEGQVVVDVVAAAVNFPDVLIVANQYQVSIPVPFTPGSEYAGTVSAVGPGVDGLSVGDRVMGAHIVGAFAEKTRAPASSLHKIEPGIDFATAAAFGVTYRTAYLALRTVADVQPGEWVAVLGAAGGVGLAAVELARVLGARVLAAASSEQKLAACREKGAEATVNYDEEDLKLRIRELTGGGADVVVDPVGGRYSEQALRGMRYGGRFVTVGFAAGEIPRIPLNLVLLKGPVVMGFALEGLRDHRPDDVARHDAELWALLAEGKVRPYVGGSFPLDDAVQALAEVGERRAVGKIIVEI